MKSLFAWPGGKGRLLKTLCARIPEHRLYVEAFAGSAKLLFAKDPSLGEVINDLNGDISNFYRVVKHRSAEMAEVLEQEFVHPERFEELRSSEPSDELQRALRFVYTTWYSFGAKGENFAASSLAEVWNGRRRRPLGLVRESLEAARARLQDVRIEQRDFADLLRRYDTPETFFYLDPPYVHFGNLKRYEALSAERRDELFGILKSLQGNFLLSFDDCPEVRELGMQQGFAIEEVETKYTLSSISASREQPRKELLLRKAA